MLDALAHTVPFLPQRTPPVAGRALLAAWDAARAAAGANLDGPPRRFRFSPGRAEEPPLDLLLADRDARCWAEAIDRRTGLDTAEGVAVLLRLLALVELMGRAPWLRDLFEIAPGGTLLHPALLRAAAADPLDAAARLDEEGLRQRLARPRIPGPAACRSPPRMTAPSVILVAVALLAGCAATPPSQAQRETRAVNAACQTEAERVVRYRDRGQLMRHDDYNARIGTTGYLGPQVITDQIAQVYDRDRMAAECVRGMRDGPAPAPAAGAPRGR